MTELQAEGERVLAAVGDDPLRAGERAEALDRRARAAGDVTASVTALRAVSLSWLYRGDLDRARKALQRAARAARGAQPHVEGLIHLANVAVEAESGRSRKALARADAALRLLEGPERADAALYRAMVLQLRNDAGVAAGFEDALAEARRWDRPIVELKVRFNRATAFVERGELAAARADLEAGLCAARRLGLATFVQLAEFHLAQVSLYQGDLPAALALADTIAEDASVDPLKAGHLAETLVGARLGSEARRVVEAALAAGQPGPRVAGELHLVSARACLVDRDPSSARRSAGAAIDALRGQGRPALRAEAVLVDGMARFALLERDDREADASGAGAATTEAGDADDVARIAADVAGVVRALERAGHRGSAWAARLLVARCRLEAGERGAARRALGVVPPRRAVRSLPATERVQLCQARALVSLAAGDDGAAAAAARAGLEELDRLRSSLGAAELRATIGDLGADLADLGLGLALDSGRAARVFSWRELAQTATSRLAAVRPPDDEELRALLGRLRALPLDAQPAQRVRLERAVVRRSRQLGGAVVVERPVTIGRLREQLGEQALVSYVRHRGRLHALTVTPRRVRLFDLGQWSRSAVERRRARAALDRMSRARSESRAAAASLRAFHQATARLDDVLMAPLHGELGGREAVIVAGAGLASLPWPALASLRARPFTLTPSATLWARANRQEGRCARRRLLAVAGPDLAAAPYEARAVAAVAGDDCVVLEGADATVSGVLDRLGGVEVAHLAAHGELRHDNPLLSALRLADGPLTVYDLEQLGRLPASIVLSACEVGHSAVRADEELLGLTTSLLAAGVRSIVAASTPVPDEEAAPFMVELHRGLADGVPARRALADARAKSPDDARAVAVAASFCCHGAG